MRLLGLLGLLVALGGGPTAALAQTLAQAPAAKPAAPAAQLDAGEPAWRALTTRQRQNLAPLERDWSGLSAASKAKWLEVSQRLPTMPVDEQQRVQARMAEWARLTPAERGQARLSFQEKKALTPEQKQQRWEAYQALPDDHRRALAAKAQVIDERKRNPTAASAPLPATAASSLGETQAKRSAAPTTASPRTLARPVAPLMVQAKPGATTTLITNAAEPPAHQVPGQPKIAAKPGQVDNKTLLPKSGPQASASAAPTTSAAAAGLANPANSANSATSAIRKP
jgi:hypothetical protein